MSAWLLHRQAARGRARGVAARRRPGRRPRRRRPRPTWWSTASSASAVVRVCATTRWPRSSALAGVPVVAVDVPSRVDVDTGELAGPAVRADVTVTFGTHKVALLADPAAAYAGVVHLVDIGLEPPPRGRRGAAERRRGRPAAPARRRTRRSTPAAWSASAPARRPTPAPGCCASPARRPGCAGWSATSAARRDAVLAAHPDVVAGTGRVQAWTVGSGGGADVATMLAEALGDGVPTGRRRRRARPGRRSR